MTFEEARAQFPVLERFAHLNAGSLGPLSRATLDAMAERMRFDQDRGRGGKAWYDSLLALRESVREGIAAVIGAPPERVALTSSTTDGCNIVLSGLGLAAGDEVVTTDSEHPGLLLPLHVSGATVRVAEVAARPTANALDEILSHVTPRTRLVALSHVLWTTGQVIPVHELKRETGLPVLVDGGIFAGWMVAAIVARERQHGIAAGFARERRVHESDLRRTGAIGPPANANASPIRAARSSSRTTGSSGALLRRMKVPQFRPPRTLFASPMAVRSENDSSTKDRASTTNAISGERISSGLMILWMPSYTEKAAPTVNSMTDTTNP